MSLLRTPLEQISAVDLHALIANQVIESRFIEYKSVAVFREASDKIKFLAANSGRGHYIIGVRASEGIPVEITGMPSASLDEKKLELEQVILTY